MYTPVGTDKRAWTDCRTPSYFSSRSQMLRLRTRVIVVLEGERQLLRPGGVRRAHVGGRLCWSAGQNVRFVLH